MKCFFLITGIISVLYGLLVLLVLGIHSIFNYGFLLLGIILLLIYLLYERYHEKKMFKILLGFILICFLIFAFTEIKIFSYSRKGPESNADYVILLGSQVRHDGPSRDFRARIESAYEYLTENPDCKVITTGGQGSNEPTSEGQAAYDYLIAKGIDKDRIYIENTSTSTYENLLNARDIITSNGHDYKNCKIVIASSEFHLYRASYIAGKLGFNNVSGKGSCGIKALNPQFYTREFFGMIKEIIVLNASGK